jgi:hypothetical protein
VAEAMCALAIYDAWLSQSELSRETIPTVSGYEWDLIEKALIQFEPDRIPE